VTSGSTAPRRAPPAHALWLLCAAGLLHACYSKEPAREAPSAPPPPPAAEPEPAAVQPTAPPEAAPSMDTDSEASGAAPAKPAPPASVQSAPKAKSAGEARRARPSAGAPAREEADEAPAESKRALSQPETLMQRLDREVSLATPDCPSARDRKKAICDLANQICRLVDRDPNVASAERYCDEAKQRCADAGERTLSRCGD